MRLIPTRNGDQIRKRFTLENAFLQRPVSLDPLPSPTYALLYRSLTFGLSEAGFLRVVADVTREQTSQGLTGYVLCSFTGTSALGVIRQWIEGDEQAVLRGYESIGDDGRQMPVRILAQGPSEELLGRDERLFPDVPIGCERVSTVPSTLEGFLEHALSIRHRK